MNELPPLKALDILLYFTPGSLVSEIISFGEGMGSISQVSHIELSLGNGRSWASRDGIGVGEYGHRTDGLVMIRRPIGEPDMVKAGEMFHAVNGVPYGMNDNLLPRGIDLSQIGPLDLAKLKVGSIGLNCSHFAGIVLHAAGLNQFAQDFNLRFATPRDFTISPANQKIWSAS